MAPLDSRLRTVGGSSASSRTPSGKGEEVSPQLKQKAEDIADKLLDRLRPHVYEAALFALIRQRDESSAKIWLERRIFRPAQQLFDQTTKLKKSNVPPPSHKPKLPADVTGTWPKRTSRNPGPTPAPPTAARPSPELLQKDERDDAARALRRALARPDRASVPSPASSRRPVPPPPGGTIQDSLRRADAGSHSSHSPLADVPQTPPGERAATPESKPAISVVQAHEQESQEIVFPAPISDTKDLSRSLDSESDALRFLDTPERQANLLVKLLYEAAPSSCILVHTVNRRTQEAVAVGVHGEHAAALAGWVTEAEDQLLTQLRRTRRPVRISSPARDDRCRKGRWTVFPPQKYLATIPVVHEHKLLGFFELADPLESNRFSQNQLDAMDRLAKAWASRLAMVR